MIFQNHICNLIKVIYFKDQYCTIPAKTSLNTIIIKNKKKLWNIKDDDVKWNTSLSNWFWVLVALNSFDFYQTAALVKEELKVTANNSNVNNDGFEYKTFISLLIDW